MSWVYTWIARPWVCTWIARRCRNSSGRLGMGPPGKQLVMVLLVHTSKAVQGQQRSTGHGPPGKTASCGPLGGHEQSGIGTAAVDWAWEPPGKTAPPQRSQDQGSRQWCSEEWSGGAVGDAGAEVTMLSG